MARAEHANSRKVADVLGALVATLLAFTAVPAVLVLVVGNPLDGGLGHGWQPISRDVLCAVLLAAWVAWAACCAQLVRAVVAHVRRGAPADATGTSVIDRLAARIAVGVVALGSLGAPLVLTTGAGGAALPTSAVGVEAPASRALEPGRPLALSAQTQAEVTVTVRAGDSLWQLAQAHLDDGAEWSTLAALNLGRPMPGGTRFVDPDQLRGGWHLVLPASGHHTTHPAVAPDGARGRLDARLPELTVLGIGSITCAALARRARRRRDRGRLFVDDRPLSPDGLADRGSLDASMSAEAIDAGTLLARFENVPALPAFEAANALLGAVTEADDGAGLPVRTVCVGPEGVTFWLRSPVTRAPERFVALDDGMAWRVGHDHLTDARPADPALPIVLPIGTDQDGTWLVVLGPGEVLPLLGPSAEALGRAARVAQESWAWSDRVVVAVHADDPRLGLLSAERADRGRVLFFGDPGALTPATARRASIVTTTPVTGSDLSILVDTRAATIHPLGRVVHPHLLTESTTRVVEEFVDGRPDSLMRDGSEGCAGGVHRHETRAVAIGPVRLSRTEPGTVEVRLLTIAPRLEGLVEELPPNRARRAVELVAYLAIHHPDVVTSDRLRTRVLGSSDADAAAKTLFNTAYAARRAMGLDAQGDPLFPAGSRNGLYRLSEDVTVDVQRAIELVEAARTSTSEDGAIASYCAALNLVEGEPLANVLSGYTWWETEGHAGRIAATLVEAACTLAALAPDRGLFDLAQWGVEQARLVAPYSEALSRAAMELAAAEGDADRLRHEWRSCQRMVDTLDPGASPSPRTESLYGELSRRVLVSAGRGERPGRYEPATSDWTSAADP